MSEKLDIRYLTSRNVLELYATIYGSDRAHYCIRPDILELVLEEIQNDAAYPNFADKLATLFCSILQNHLFTDGNKHMSVQVGALFMQANGYQLFVERYITEMYRFMPCIARGLIGQELINEILASIVEGGSNYDEALQLRILFAIDESIDESATSDDENEWFWFEKQNKLTERADNSNSVDRKCVKYPCVKLVFNHNWDDFGNKTWFSVWYVTDQSTLKYLGDTKIMSVQGESFDEMEEGFSELGEDFCSLGMNSSYYQQILDMLGKQNAKRLLKALRDSAIDDIVYEQFSEEPAFRNSLLRDISSEKALREARFILENRKKSEAYSFQYHFVPDYNTEYDATWKVNIDYNAVSYKLTYAIIGENAVGKTMLLSKFMHDLTLKRVLNFEKVPMLSSVLVICSSTFDSYNKRQPRKTRIPLNVCSVVQDGKTQKRLSNAINTILKRGTIFTDGLVFPIRKKYCILLDSLLEKGFSDSLFEIIETDAGKMMSLRIEKLEEYIDQMSTGQLQIFSLVTYFCAYIHLKSIVIVDEPEVHLHPRMITHFFRAMNELLSVFQSYAIVATHSPIVVRECVDENVYMMVRNEYKEPTIKTVPFRTFGEDITTLYENIFGFQESNSHFYKTIENMVENDLSDFDTIIKTMQGQGVHLSMNAVNAIAYCLDKKQVD